MVMVSVMVVASVGFCGGGRCHNCYNVGGQCGGGWSSCWLVTVVVCHLGTVYSVQCTGLLESNPRIELLLSHLVDLGGGVDGDGHCYGGC